MRTQAGFSLLEVLVALAILSLTLLSLADVLMLELTQTKNIYQKTLQTLQVKETEH